MPTPCHTKPPPILLHHMPQCTTPYPNLPYQASKNSSTPHHIRNWSHCAVLCSNVWLNLAFVHLHTLDWLDSAMAWFCSNYSWLCKIPLLFPAAKQKMIPYLQSSGTNTYIVSFLVILGLNWVPSEIEFMRNIRLLKAKIILPLHTLFYYHSSFPISPTHPFQLLLSVSSW